MRKKIIAPNESSETLLVLNGTSYQLEFDFNAYVRVQELTGINLLNTSEFSPLQLRASLWAALLPSNPEMTLEEAGKLIRPATMPKIIAAVNAVWSVSPTEEAEDGE